MKQTIGVNVVFTGRIRNSLKAIVLLTALISSAPNAASTFDFQYTFGDSTHVTGSLTGSLVGSYITNIGDVHVSINGIPLNGEPLFAIAYNTVLHTWDNTIEALVSPDATLNNFLFIDSNYPTDSNYTNVFHMHNDLVSGIAAGAAWVNGFSAYEEFIIAENWTITQSNGIPEPATLALVGLGLAGLGFSRRKQ